MKTAVKICGITNFDDARVAVEAGAQFLGLNFFPDSPRFLEPGAAAKLAEKIKSKLPDAKLVGVFVDELPERIRQLAKICELDILQFHGTESPEFCAQFPQKIWRAFRVRDENSFDDLEQFLELDGIVLDAFRKGKFGGTGQTFDWQLIHRIRDELPNFILAGGLTPANIRRAVEQLRPNVIDLASGVELKNNPRKKDPRKIAELFVELKKVS
jgi:phosphoribosylanthranilate isomerase